MEGIEIGIKINREQVYHFQRNGLDVHILDYRALPKKWVGTFDWLRANGLMEHFICPDDVARRRADDIYRNLFIAVYHLIHPASSGPTVRHDYNPCPSKAVVSDDTVAQSVHLPSVLEQAWGGYYPEPEQLERCAEGRFDLVE